MEPKMKMKMELNMNQNKLWKLLLPLFIVATLSSCIDGKIAKDIGGTWNRSFSGTNDDGTYYHYDEYMTFYKRKNENCGTFTETIAKEEPIDDDNFYGRYEWTSYIAGTWEIKYRDLILTYNTSSLSVKIDKDNLDINLKPEALQNDGFSILAIGIEASIYSKELKQDTYKRLFDFYEGQNGDNNEGTEYTYVTIKNNELSFTDIDGDLLTYKKVVNKKDDNSKDRQISASSL